METISFLRKYRQNIDLLTGVVLLIMGIIFSLTRFIPPDILFYFQLIVPVILIVYLSAIFILLFTLIFKLRLSSIVVILYLLYNVGDFYRTVGISIGHTSESIDNLSVMSYNVSFFKSTQFNPYHKVDSTETAQSLAIQQTIIDHEADIICLQEYYQDDNVSVYQLNNRLPEYQHFFLTRPSYEKGRSGGISIFSKYPIIDQGVVLVDSTNRYNGVAFVDVLFGSDTLRVVNAHLHSMQIRPDRIFSLNSFFSILRTYKRGSIIRQNQVSKVVEFIQASPYEIILTGDLNELSKSYNYTQIAKLLDDTFVAVGKGLGYTLNKSRWALFRIDYQFFSAGLEPVSFQVLRENTISEHFPTLATYQVR